MRKLGMLLGLGVVLAGALETVFASGGLLKKSHPPCEPGYQWVEEVCYKDVERKVCKIVPDVKKVKKIVYDTKDDPFCIHKSGVHGWHGLRDCLKHGCADKQACESCPKEDCCDGPYCRKQLVKREIVCEEPTTKCVVETIVEKVCYTVLKKVPCGSPACAPSAAPTPAAVTPPAVRPEVVTPPDVKKLPK